MFGYLFDKERISIPELNQEIQDLLKRIKDAEGLNIGCNLKDITFDTNGNIPDAISEYNESKNTAATPKSVKAVYDAVFRRDGGGYSPNDCLVTDTAVVNTCLHIGHTGRVDNTSTSPTLLIQSSAGTRAPIMIVQKKNNTTPALMLYDEQTIIHTTDPSLNESGSHNEQHLAFTYDSGLNYSIRGSNYNKTIFHVGSGEATIDVSEEIRLKSSNQARIIASNVISHESQNVYSVSSKNIYNVGCGDVADMRYTLTMNSKDCIALTVESGSYFSEVFSLRGKLGKEEELSICNQSIKRYMHLGHPMQGCLGFTREGFLIVNEQLLLDQLSLQTPQPTFTIGASYNQYTFKLGERSELNNTPLSITESLSVGKSLSVREKLSVIGDLEGNSTNIIKNFKTISGIIPANPDIINEDDYTDKSSDLYGIPAPPASGSTDPDYSKKTDIINIRLIKAQKLCTNYIYLKPNATLYGDIASTIDVDVIDGNTIRHNGMRLEDRYLDVYGNQSIDSSNNVREIYRPIKVFDKDYGEENNPTKDNILIDGSGISKDGDYVGLYQISLNEYDIYEMFINTTLEELIEIENRHLNGELNDSSYDVLKREKLNNVDPKILSIFYSDKNVLLYPDSTTSETNGGILCLRGGKVDLAYDGGWSQHTERVYYFIDLDSMSKREIKYIINADNTICFKDCYYSNILTAMNGFSHGFLIANSGKIDALYGEYKTDVIPISRHDNDFTISWLKADDVKNHIYNSADDLATPAIATSDKYGHVKFKDTMMLTSTEDAHSIVPSINVVDERTKHICIDGNDSPYMYDIEPVMTYTSPVGKFVSNMAQWKIDGAVIHTSYLIGIRINFCIEDINHWFDIKVKNIRSLVDYPERLSEIWSSIIRRSPSAEPDSSVYTTIALKPCTGSTIKETYGNDLDILNVDGGDYPFETCINNHYDKVTYIKIFYYSKYPYSISGEKIYGSRLFIGPHTSNEIENNLKIGTINSPKYPISVIGDRSEMPFSSSGEYLMKLDSTGNLQIAGTLASNSGADYSEYILEWEDGNENGEDRRGLFVTSRNGKLIKASASDHILGIVSSNPTVTGNTHSDIWKDAYIRDIFGSIIYDDVDTSYTETEYEDLVLDDGTICENAIVKTITKTSTTKQPRLNPNYDSTQTYIPRSERKEWDFIGIVGQLVVVDDGTCIVDGLCNVKENGIGTTSSTGWPVIQRLDDTHVKVLFGFGQIIQ